MLNSVGTVTYVQQCKNSTVYSTVEKHNHKYTEPEHSHKYMEEEHSRKYTEPEYPYVYECRMEITKVSKPVLWLMGITYLS